jgi:maltose-binding protein MalE
MREGMTRWNKLAGCSLLTENYGDSGYIYKTGKYWIAVTIFENGDEMDTPCSTRAEARHVVETYATQWEVK